MAPGLEQRALMRVCDLKHSVTLLRGIKHDNYMDLMFICRGNVKVFAQKLVLLSVSPFLKVLLSHMSCCQHNMFCVSLPDIDSGSLQLVLNFLYEGVMKVWASELEGFSDAMYVLGIEIPQTATASVVETLDPSELPSSRSRAFAPAQRPSQLEVNEPVDPLNVPDYYHDTAMAPLAAGSSTVLVPNYSAMLVLNGNPGEAVGQLPTSSRASNSAHSSTTMIIPNTNVTRMEETINSKLKIGKSSLTEDQIRFLDQEFLKNSSPSVRYKKILAKKLKVNEKVIKTWFTNTRRKVRVKRQYLMATVPDTNNAQPGITVKEEVNLFDTVG